MNDQETKNIVEAMEQWKKMHEITADDIREYIRIPRFSKSKKEKIFDIVREIGIKNNKAEIEYLFTSEEYKQRKLFNTPTGIMMDIDFDAITRDSLHKRFIEECTSMVKAEFDIINPEFAYEECFKNAYESITNSECRLIAFKWSDNCISIEEWKNFLISIAK